MSLPMSVVYAQMENREQAKAYNRVHRMQSWVTDDLRKLEEDTARRNQAVKEALELGVTATTLAEVLDVTRSRVYQMRDDAE